MLTVLMIANQSAMLLLESVGKVRYIMFIVYVFTI